MSLFLGDKNLGEGCRSIARVPSRRATIRHCRRASILFSPLRAAAIIAVIPMAGYSRVKHQPRSSNRF